MASRCYELSGLGYVGVDFVLDRNQGPLILELNARPGLAIQMANGNGLHHRLRKVQALEAGGQLETDAAQRVAFARANFPTLG
jgi:glutathione synthase/RimK-type ligase-like ATP-grasp enzyme